MVHGMATIGLLDVALHPVDIPMRWRAYPFVSAQAFHEVVARPAERVVSDLADVSATLYTGTFGLINGSEVKRLPLTARELERTQAMVRILHDKGMTIAAPPTSDGCSCVHQALLLGDDAAASFLLGLEGGRDVAGNSTSSTPACRQPISTLLAARGRPSS